jgi:hypothetical protein
MAYLHSYTAITYTTWHSYIEITYTTWHRYIATQQSHIPHDIAT